MQEWIIEHKLSVVLSFLAIIILVFLLLLGGNKKEENFEPLENETPVITCSHSGKASNVMITQKIEIYDRDSERLLVQTTEMSVEKKELQETLDIVFNSTLTQQEQLIEEKFGSNFEYISVESEKKDSMNTMKVYYKYNNNNYNEMFPIFNLNVYASTYNEIITYFESGGLSCVRG